MRNIAFFAVGLLLILIQGNLHRVLGPLGWHGVTPSLALPMIVFLGVHEHSIPRGAITSFALGHALDLFASAPNWLFTFVAVAIWWLARVAGVRLTAQTMLTRMSLGLVFALVESAIVLVLLAVFGADSKRPLELWTITVPHALSTSLVSPIVFRIAQRLHQGGAPAGSPAEGALP